MSSPKSLLWIQGSLLITCLLLLWQSQTGNTAPTHHLTISVEGDTPTLVVTSAEIGITPTIPPAVTVATTSPIGPVGTKTYKNNAQKPSKNKSTLKSQYTKKRQEHTIVKDTKTILREKSMIAKVGADNTRITETTTTTTTEASTPLNEESTKSVAATSTAMATSTKPTITTTDANDATTDNRYKTAALPTTVAPSPTQTSEVTSTQTPTTQQQQKETSDTIEVESTTLGSLPGNVQQTTLVTLAPITNTAKSEMLSLTSADSLIISKDSERNKGNIDKLDIKSVPAAMLINSNKNVDTTIVPTSKPETTTSSTVATPVISTETVLDVEKLLITKTKVADIKSNYGKVDKNVAASQTVAVTPQFSTQTATVNVSNTEVTTQTPNQPTITTPDSNTSENTQKRVLVTSEAQAAPATLTTAKMSVVISAKEHDGIVKLIDLEKHGDLKSIDEVQQQQRRKQDKDDGHDGVKKTKKKQLIDKHILVETTMESTTSATTTWSTSSEVITPSTIPAHNQKIAGNQHTISQKKVKKSMTSPTLMPVHNGYLGPIFMEEKTFSVIHANKKAQSAQHVASIASQLRNGRIVEIIAPTSILEEQIIATTPHNEKATTTILPPTVRKTLPLQNLPVLSTTVFQVSDSMTSTTRLPASPKLTQLGIEGFAKAAVLVNNNEKTESKISDIQIEVYDSTIDSIVASTNFKDNDGYYSLPFESSAVGTTKPPASAFAEERFTQYVVDRTDSSTQESLLAPLHIAAGKPEPAAIEIHINVSEGFGNESEDLEFSYRQSDYFRNSRPNVLNNYAAAPIKPKPLVKPLGYASAPKRYTNTGSSSERSDEILVVEIIDTGENSTENSASSENLNPIFTFRADKDTELDMKEIKYFPQGTVVKPAQLSDELFMADLKKDAINFPKPPPPPPPPPRKPTIDRDSDTIFYISNTEVKVSESLPTTNTKFEQQLRKSRLENQFFPVNYMASTHPNAAKPDESIYQEHRYEEDILLSPLRNTADSLKIFRSQGDGAPPLDVTYVGESIIEVGEQSSGASITTTVAPSQSQQPPDVIIQPAILPEMSIGVPVIGELPPQIELKEIDFMPDEANQQRSGVYENDIEENVNGNDVDRLVESSIQYGGDLIDEDAGGGFDGVEGSYPFGNPASMRNRKAKHVADYAHFAVNHGVNNLRKDELSVDVGSSSSGEIIAVGAAAVGNAENTTLKDLLNRNGNDTSMNISYAVAERMGNATAFSVMDDPGGTAEGELGFKNLYTLIIGLFIVLLPAVVIVSMACALRYLYSKYQSSSSDNNDNTDPHQANGNAGDGGEQGESTQPPSPTKSDIEKELTTKNEKTPTDKSSKPSNSHINIIDEMCQGAQSAQIMSNVTKPISQSDYSDSVQGQYSGPNGSVTKMTLQNNHLIVETEERNDISRDARETKMHYNTSEKDGVFVVEVARGIDSKTIPDSPIADASEKRLPVYEAAKHNGGMTIKTEDEKVLKNHEEVQIHQPPPEILPNSNPAEELQRSLHQIEEVDEPTPSPNSAVGRVAAGEEEENNLVRNSNTGLSQSDLSSTSSTDSNKRYSYGNQELYTIEQPGYATLSSTANLPLVTPADDETQDDDRKSENGHSLEHSPAQGNGNVTNEEIDKSNTVSKDNTDKEMYPTKMTDKCRLNGYVEDEHNAEETKDINKGRDEVNGKQEIGTIEMSQKQVLICDEIPASAITENTHLLQQNVEIYAEVPAASATTTESTEFSQMPTVVPDEMPALTDTMNTATVSIEEHELKQVNGYTNGEHEPNLTNGHNEESERTYDSIMSLPDPPTTEEITQLNDYSLNADNNQLDSLPPPPPPPLLLAYSDNSNGTEEVKQNMQALAAPIKQFLKHALVDEMPALINDGIETPPQLNGHVTSTFLSSLPPPMEVETTRNGKILPITLTPPASPPPSPPAHFSNGGAIVVGMSSLPVAVDVNGS